EGGYKGGLDAAVKIKMKKDLAGGGADLGYDDKSKTVMTASKYADKISWESTGGDPTFNSQPDLWIPTVNNPLSWHVISYSPAPPPGQDAGLGKLVSIIEFLKDESAPGQKNRKQKIERVEEAKKKEAWCTNELAELMKTNPALKVPEKYVLPIFPKGHG